MYIIAISRGHYIMNSNCTNTLAKYKWKVPIMGMCLYNVFIIAYTQYRLLPWTVIIVIIRVTYTYRYCKYRLSNDKFFYLSLCKKLNCTHTIILITIPTTRDRRTLCVRFIWVHMDELNLMVSENIILYWKITSFDRIIWLILQQRNS